MCYREQILKSSYEKINELRQQLEQRNDEAKVMSLFWCHSHAYCILIRTVILYSCARSWKLCDNSTSENKSKRLQSLTS